MEAKAVASARMHVQTTPSYQARNRKVVLKRQASEAMAARDKASIPSPPTLFTTSTHKTMASGEYVVLQGVPAPQAYHDLRKLAGLTPPWPEAMAEAVPKALQNSFAGFVVYEGRLMASDTTPSADQELVGMGRLSGDGGLFLLVTDIAVHPDHRRKGIAKAIMKALVGYIDEHAPHAYVSLVADPMGQQLYPQFGFEGVGHSVGMFRCPRLQQDGAWRESRGHKQVASREAQEGGGGGQAEG